jgi:hypothetical protein
MIGKVNGRLRFRICEAVVLLPNSQLDLALATPNAHPRMTE